MIKNQFSLEKEYLSVLTMFANKIINFRFITSSLKSQKLQKVSTIARNSSSRSCPINGVELFNNQSTYLVTSAGKSLRDFTSTNKVYNSASQETSGKFIVDYDDLLKAQKDDKVLIIDVREDSEIQETGKLPGSVHIPMGEVKHALVDLSSEEFEKKYNKKQPEANTKIILSCKLGKRSGAVQSDLQKLGYTNAHNYVGGWLDWESRQK